MDHLSFDELYELAYANANDEGFNEYQISLLEHLKTCKDCYESFCLLSALSDVISDSGSYALDTKVIPAEVECSTKVRRKNVAKFRVIRSIASKTFETIIEQINPEESFLQFGPALATATRGAGKSESNTVRLEEYEDARNYIVYISDSNELKLQLNIHTLNISNLHVTIESDDSYVQEVPLVKKGNFVTATIRDIPADDFSITIDGLE